MSEYVNSMVLPEEINSITEVPYVYASMMVLVQYVVRTFLPSCYSSLNGCLRLLFPVSQ